MGSLTVIAGKFIYLDSNVLIYAVEDVSGNGRQLRPLFDRIDQGELRGVTSELALAEVLVRPLREGNGATRREYEALLHPAGPLTVEPVSRRILSKAAELRAAHASLKLPDAIHAATSFLTGCSTFLTNDARFEAVTDLPTLLLTKLP